LRPAHYLAVHADARRRGLGREMMAAAEAWLARRGIPKLQLMVRDDNRIAHGFYEAIGYAHDAVTVFSRRLSG
jgi:ribosomal protein S18 acetylase RimI-like enzyme